MSNLNVPDHNDGAGVRFSAQNQEIPPNTSLHAVESLTGPADTGRRDLGPEAENEIKQLKSTLEGTVQSRRMQQYSFEPVSLPGSQPVSRVPSGTTTPSRRLPAGSAAPSPRHSPPPSTMHSPPLTPAVTGREGKQSTSGPSVSQAQRTKAQADTVTPQRSISPARPGTAGRTAPTDVVAAQPRQGPRFSLGAAGDSVSPSADASPMATPDVLTPSGPTTPSHEEDSIEARFRFGNRDPRQGHSGSGTNLSAAQDSSSTLLGSGAGSFGSATNLRAQEENAKAAAAAEEANKRHTLFGGAKPHEEKEKSHSNLKRFFKFGGGHHKSKERKAHSPTRDGTVTPPAHKGSVSIPFADDHGLQSKYGKFGKMLGSGAGGSVRLMKRTGDGKTFAVKQFRNRHNHESERDYNKKVTAEFCIGSTLHHGNIIETIDIVFEKGSWFEVMEYAPYDLFATVMTGKMGRDEITCCTLQILSGVAYLHSMGLAHRDLKLDNVVINEHGIMKIIDFGSAVVFQYPFEKGPVLATGVVGSDPYLAPEVYDNAKYDPQPTDIWSIAIVYCCMCLRRFPWKAPRVSDNSYRLFVSPPDPGQEALLAQSRRPSSRNPSASEGSGETASTNPQSSQIKGPLRLLRLLPRESRHIIGRMLELDPKRRATIDEVLADPWVANSLVCTQEEGGQCLHAPNHTHALEGGGKKE